MAKEKPMVISMDTWEDWFENCGRLIPMFATYEDMLWNYYDFKYAKKQESKKYQEYATHHTCKFYENEEVFPKWKWTSVFAKGFLGLLIGYVLGLLLFWWKDSFSVGLKNGLCTGLIGFCLVCGIWYTVVVQKSLRIRRQLTNQLELILPRIQYVPPKYRNSIAMKYLYDMYLNQPGILTFQQAIQALDKWFASLPRNNNCYIGRVIAVGFDAPYEPTGVMEDVAEEQRELYEVDAANPALQNPNLPKDMANHAFKGVDNPEELLNKLIGLENVKQQVSQMKNRMKFYHTTGGKTEKISGNHMCFLGSPGTGKTTVARILTRILYDFGYIRDNKCVEVDGNYFKSSYVGQTAARTQAILDFANGGVLFIDEAYLLLDTKGQTGTVGTEALGALLKYMEDHQSDLVVIFAGYEDAVNRLLSSNEGFASRIKYKIYFQDFSLDELMKIFRLDMQKYSKQHPYKIAKDAERLLRQSFELDRKSPTFGNARVVRNALDMILDIHADHYMNRVISEMEKFVITVADVEVYVKAREQQRLEDTRNYIASQNLDSQIVNFSDLKSRTKAGSTNPDKELQAMTGLKMLKDEVAQMKQTFAFYDGNVERDEGYHMCFMGAPGTGKSTVAKIITGYLYEMGIIQRNEYLDINGDFLRGMYVGHTGKRTEAVINYCQGMVLFLDEAYLLAQGKDGDNFGQEAIGVLIDAMEKRRHDFVVIVAGYEREMKAFLSTNSGMASRISTTFHFESYSPHELAQMLQRIARKEQFGFDIDVWLPLQKYFQTCLNDPYFGNGRFVRSLWQDIKQAHIMRFTSQQLDNSERYQISLADCQQGIAQKEAKKA